MAEVNKSKVKMFLPAIVLATSLHYSLLFTTGIVAGYLACRIFCKLFLKHGDNVNGKIEKIFIDMGKWKLHLHHWIMGIMFLGLVWIVDYFYLPTFFAGVVCGVIIQDIYDYNDWMQVIIKNEDYEKIAK